MSETVAPTDHIEGVIYDERAPLVLELGDQLTADEARDYLERRLDEENEALANAGSAMEYWHRDQRDRIEQLLALIPAATEAGHQ